MRTVMPGAVSERFLLLQTPVSQRKRIHWYWLGSFLLFLFCSELLLHSLTIVLKFSCDGKTNMYERGWVWGDCPLVWKGAQAAAASLCHEWVRMTLGTRAPSGLRPFPNPSTDLSPALFLFLSTVLSD